MACKGTPCWGCKNTNTVPPSKDFCEKTKPKNDSRCKCYPQGILGQTTPKLTDAAMCYECKGCSNKRTPPCFSCANECLERTNLNYGSTNQVKWMGDSCFISNVTVDVKVDISGFQTNGCNSQCAKQKDCWKWNEDDIPSDIKNKVVKTTCSLFKDCATLGKITGKDSKKRRAGAFELATVPSCWLDCYSSL